MTKTRVATSAAAVWAVVLTLSVFGSAGPLLAGEDLMLGDVDARTGSARLDIAYDRGHGDDDDDDDDAGRCERVRGNATWTVIPAPNDPLGRILGPSTGDLKAAISAHVTSLIPGDNGALHATSVEVWVLGAQDILIFDGEATFTPIPGQPIGTVYDELSLTVTGGTGEYAGATGALEVTGVGRNIFGPDAGPGAGFFEVRYRGEICQAR